MKDHDVIIVGASFAGLAVANQLSAHRVLLIDRKPVGSGQTSACGTILQVLQNWDLTESVLQRHDSIVLHTARNSFEFPSPYPWCTFDYRNLCQLLFERSDADYLQATVMGCDREIVHTSHGNFRARCVVDASGWRAVIASSLQPGFERKNEMNFGIETIGSLPNDAHLDPTNLHFWYDPAILKSGVGWVFPRGETAIFGVGSYRGATHLRRPLTQFVDRLFIQPNGLHGTYFPKSLRNPLAGNVFVVGDAAGMCIGLTGEGIRPALFFGEACGRIVNRVLVGEFTLEAGLSEYSDFVEARRYFYQIFSGAQEILSRVPTNWIDVISRFVSHELVLPWVLDQYWGLTRAWNKTSRVLLTRPVIEH